METDLVVLFFLTRALSSIFNTIHTKRNPLRCCGKTPFWKE